MSSPNNATEPQQPATSKTAEQESTSSSSSSSPENTKLKPIKTFHCRYCSHLLLASTRPFLSTESASSQHLKRRGGAARDRALILDINIPSRRRQAQPASTEGPKGGGNTGAEGANTQQEEKEKGEEEEEEEVKNESTAKDKETVQREAHYTIPLATLLPDSKPVVIRRDDGFEKRVLNRCGRCRVVVGYEIVPPTSTNSTSQSENKVLYLLPGSLVGTEDLGQVENNAVLKQMEAEWAQWVAV